MRAVAHAIAVLAVLPLAACGGRASNPVMTHQYGDDERSCQALVREMTFIEGEIQRLVPQTDKTGKNVALGVTGVLFIVPLFFMDLSHAEQEEVNAYRRRYNHLAIIADDKGCDVPEPEPVEPMAAPEPEGDPGAGSN